jgi:Ca2+-binding EF-hand superfamily protein
MTRRWPLYFSAAMLGTAMLWAADKDKDRGTGDKPQPKKGAPSPFVDTSEFLREHDRNKDGSLSKNELPAWLHHNFPRLDANKDGKISKDELEKGVAYLHQRRRPSDLMAVLVEMSDCDECCMEEVQRAYDTLRKLDANGDGKISAEELKECRSQIVRERVAGLIERLDDNKDGKLSKDETRGQLRDDFEELDRDKDGFLSREEIHAGASARPRPGTEK